MRSNRDKEPDYLSGLFMFFLGTALCLSSWQIGLGSLSKPGAGFMPFLVGLTLAFLSLILVVRVYLNNGGPPWKISIKWNKILYALALMVAYGLLIERIGLILVTFLFITLMMKYMGSLSWLKSLLGGITSSLASYVLFVFLLRTQIPYGVRGFF